MTPEMVGGYFPSELSGRLILVLVVTPGSFDCSLLLLLLMQVEPTQGGWWEINRESPDF